MRLAPVTYSVDASDPTNPKLTRAINGGAPEVLAEQVIGFKIGAGLWNADTSAAGGTDQDYYTFKNYNWGGCSTCYDPSQIRSLRVSLIARTPPNLSSDFAFENSFDGGHYQIQALSVGINPRNLSMNDGNNVP